MSKILISSALVLLVVGCGGAGPSPGTDTEDHLPTYHRDVRPILVQRCGECHGAGIYPVFTENSVPVLIGSMLEDIKTGRMPPWVPGPLGVPLEHKRSVPQEDIGTLTSWAQRGMRIGDSSEYAARPTVDGFVPSRPADVELKIPVPYLPDRTKTDDDRCFLLPPYTGSIVAYQWIPDPAVPKHHIAAFTLGAAGVAAARAKDPTGTGWDCPTDFGVPSITLLGAVGLGVAGGQEYPTGTSVAVPAGLVLQVHSLPMLATGPARDGIRIWSAAPGSISIASFTIQAPVELPCPDSASGACSRDAALADPIVRAEHEARLTSCGYASYADYLARGIRPSGPGEYLIATQCEAPAPIAGRIVGMHIHAHTWAKNARLSLQRPDGSWQILIDLPVWRYVWESSYTPKIPVPVRQGQRLKLECLYDNGTANQWSARTGKPGHDAPAEPPLLPPAHIKTGPQLGDEMCALFGEIAP